MNARLTSIKPIEEPFQDPHVTALQVLGWILADPHRAQRLLDLTGLSPDTLRESAAAPSTHRAVLDFLCAHEPDLIAAAEALSISPEELVSARRRLRR